MGRFKSVHNDYYFIIVISKKQLQFCHCKHTHTYTHTPKKKKKNRASLPATKSNLQRENCLSFLQIYAYSVCIYSANICRCKEVDLKLALMLWVAFAAANLIQVVQLKKKKKASPFGGR